jgi:hypothetical protein
MDVRTFASVIRERTMGSSNDDDNHSDNHSDSGTPAARPLIDTPVEGLAEWDSPFRQTFVPGSSWAPWLASAGFPPHGPAQAHTRLPAPRVKPPQPPAPSAGEAEHARYRREYEARLDEAYADWKRSIFVSLFEPWIIDRCAEQAVKKLGHGLPAGS